MRARPEGNRAPRVAGAEVHGGAGLHVALSPQRLQPSTVILVLRAAGALGDLGVATGTELHEDLGHGARVGRYRCSARSAAERAISLACPLVVVQRDRWDLLPLDVLPDVQLRPVEPRMNAHM